MELFKYKNKNLPSFKFLICAFLLMACNYNDERLKIDNPNDAKIFIKDKVINCNEAKDFFIEVCETNSGRAEVINLELNNFLTRIYKAKSFFEEIQVEEKMKTLKNASKEFIACYMSLEDSFKKFAVISSKKDGKRTIDDVNSLDIIYCDIEDETKKALEKFMDKDNAFN